MGTPLNSLSAVLRYPQEVALRKGLDALIVTVNGRLYLDARPVQNLANEIDCRISHGAESEGHLEYVLKELKSLLGEASEAQWEQDREY